MNKKKQTGPAGLSRRLRYPGDEERLDWLPWLLDAYAIADTGVAIAIRDAEKRQKKKLACGQGCDVCCRQKDIPLYPHEAIGLYWYAKEKMEPKLRERVRQHLRDHAPGSPCPFLVDHACAVHPLRPVSCRQFNVFTSPCAPEEDPYFTRRDDVLTPIADYTDRAFAAVLPFYRLEGGKDAERSVKLIKAQIMNLQEHHWDKLAKMLEEGLPAQSEGPDPSKDVIG